MSKSIGVISASELEGWLDDPGVTVIEVSAAADGESYARGHIPGAQRAYWKSLVWDERERAFPAPEEAGRRLGALGARDGGRVVLYGDPVQYGTYALWALSAVGQGDLFVLDGGKEHWVGSGRRLSGEPSHSAPPAVRSFNGHNGSAVIGRDGVLAALGRPEFAVLDFRSAEEFAGERVMPRSGGAFDHGAERAGRIPGARHLHYQDLLHDDWTFRSADELITLLAARGVTEQDELIGYCRLSHRASLGWVGLTLLADRPMRVYDGSWTEWGSMVGMPIER